VHAPFSNRQCKSDVYNNGNKGNDGKFCFVLAKQYRGNQDKFSCCRNDIEYEVIEARVQTVTSEDIGNIRVTTSGGSADSDETFALTII
jgi:hypothetical protein